MSPSSNLNYVADHIDRIDRRYTGNQNHILDSKWRIANSLGMFGEHLPPNGTLTPKQVTHVDAYIAKFKTTPAGKETIAQYQRRN